MDRYWTTGPWCAPCVREAAKARAGLGVLALMLALAGAAGAEVPLRVELVKAEAKPIPYTFEATGEVIARERIALSFPTSGRITEILVEEGGQVREGQVLMRIDAVQQEQALRAAQAGLAAAEADAEKARLDLEREEALLAQGSSTRVRRDTAETTFLAANARLVQARSDLETAETALSDAVLLAPQAGVITARSAELGQVVSGAQSVLELATSKGLDALFEIPASMLVRADSGATPPKVELRMVEGDSGVFTGVVDRVSPQVDPTNGAVEVWLTIVDPPAALPFGASIRGKVTSLEPARIALPAEALAGLGRGAAVWVADPATMKVALQPVTVLRHVNGSVILEAGLEDGALVVGRGAHLLYPGRLVVAAEGTEAGQ